MKQNRIVAMLTCMGLGVSAVATTLAAKDATPVSALSLTTTTPVATTVTLAPQSYCDLCNADIPEGEGVRTPLGLFVCSACERAGAGGTTAPISDDHMGSTSTTVVTTYNPQQSTVAFTTNMYVGENGVPHYEYYAHIGDTIEIDDSLTDYPYELAGGCTYEDGILTAMEPGYCVLFFYDTESHDNVVGEVVVNVVELEPIVTTDTTVTTAATTVTSSPYYPEYNPWVTDEAGNQYYLGTNAYQDTVLKIMEYPQTTFALGEAFNTDGLKVYMIEYRNYNQRDYDVSEVLNIETDYDPNTPGQYTVYVSTDYTCGEAGTDVVLTYHVDVSEDYIYTTVVTDMTTTLPTTYTSTTTASVPSGLTCTSTSTTTTTTVTTLTTNPNETADENGVSIVKGDLTGDFTLRINDAILLNRCIAEDTIAASEAICIHNADYNNDGDVNTNDSTLLLQYLAGF